MQACSNPYLSNHTVRVYETTDLMSWRDLGLALPLLVRLPILCLAQPPQWRCIIVSVQPAKDIVQPLAPNVLLVRHVVQVGT